MTRLKSSGAGAVLTAAVLHLFTTVAATQAAEATTTAADLQTLIDRHIKPLVTVKFVLKMAAQGQTQEADYEAPGLMIQGDGLVLCSNTLIGGMMSLQKGMSAEPKDIKVLLGVEEKELPAKVLARDTDLDLVWIRIENKDNAKFDALDLAQAVHPRLGQELLCLRRMSKHFDRAPVFWTGTFCGQTDKPRKLWVVSGDLPTATGEPVFTPAGEFVGFIVMQIPKDDSGAGQGPISNPFSIAYRRDDFTGKILPAESIAKATKRALETAQTQPAKDEDKSKPEKKDADKE